jgi:hypothetical protein
MASDNDSIVKDQIRLWLIFIINSKRVLHAHAIPGFSLIRKNLCKRIHNRAVIFSDRSHKHNLPVQKLDPVVFGQNSHFSELIKLGNLELPRFRLNCHTKKDSGKSYEAFVRSATEISAEFPRKTPRAYFRFVSALARVAPSIFHGRTKAIGEMLEALEVQVRAQRLVFSGWWLAAGG